MKSSLFYLIFCFIGLTTRVYSQDTVAKEKAGLIQFSGIVVEGDSMLGVPGVSIFNPNTGRGTSSNLLGYFSLPVKVGDSLLVAAVGYQKEFYKVLEDPTGNYTVVIRLSIDTLMLPVLEIRPFPSERVFKEAFLALNVPSLYEASNMENNLNRQIMERLLMEMEDDGAMNHSYYMNQQINYMEQRYMYRTAVPLLDPFAWSRFFNDLENNKKKKKEKEREENNSSGY